MHDITNPPGQVRAGAHPAGERYRQTTLQGVYLKDVIQRIQAEEVPTPLPSVEKPPKEAYDAFQDWYGTVYHTGDSRLDMQRAWFKAKGWQHPADEENT